MMYQGGCGCRSVRYQLTGEPLTCYTCHCTDCQTSSGSAFTLAMIVSSEDVEVLIGELAINTQDTNGVEVKRHHCAQCGTALWYTADAYPNILALKPGTLHDTHWFKPIARLWLRSAQPWVVLDEASSKYQKQPKMQELFTRWAKRNST